MDERVQVNGFLLLHDGTMSDTDTAKSYNVSTMKRCMHIYQVRPLQIDFKIVYCMRKRCFISEEHDIIEIFDKSVMKISNINSFDIDTNV